MRADTFHPEFYNMEFKRLSFGFNNKPILIDSSFDFPLGTMIQLKGELGSGISTVLRILAALIVPSSGSYVVNGFDVHNKTFEEFRRYQLSIGYSPDNHGLLSNRTLFENVRLPLDYHGDMLRQDSFARTQEYFERFDICQYKDLRPALASSGMQKAACLARAMILRPRVLLLDNPTQGLTRHGIDTLIDLIRSHRKEHQLEHIFVGSADEYFLSHFEYETIELRRTKLIAFEHHEAKLA